MGMKFSEDYIRQIKESNPLFDVLNSYLSLDKVSSNAYATRCPFHKEKTASFKYHTDSKQAYCYGCGEHFGDSIDFIQGIESCNFQEAVKILAKNSGIDLPDKDDPQAKKKNKEKRLLNKKKLKFQKLLFKDSKAKKARKYLKSRGLNGELCKKWGIGFCDFSEKDSNRFKKFCNRIMFTISDEYGNPIGFSGRKLPKKEKDKYPKYINSSDEDNVLFHKKKILYGLNIAKKYIRKQDFSIVVEGFTDVISLNDVGIKNVVSSMGTAITEDQIKKLKKYSKNIILFLDGDESGQEAMKRVLSTLKKEELNIKLIKGKNGQDPAEMVEEYGVNIFKWIKDNAKTIEQFYVDKFSATYDKKVLDAKKELIDNLVSVFGKEFTINEELAITSVCNKLGISMDTLKSKINIEEE